MSKESRGKGTSRKHSATHWCLQNIAQESVDSSDEEFFDARDVMEGKSAILLGMSQWNSNDLVEQIETLGHMEDQSHEGLYQLGGPRCPPQSSIEGLEDIESKCKTHVLLLVVHGGNILDTAGGDPSTKAGDVATLASVLEKVTRVHFQAASEHVMIKLVPCPAVCAEAFSLVSNIVSESCPGVHTAAELTPQMQTGFQEAQGDLPTATHQSLVLGCDSPHRCHVWSYRRNTANMLCGSYNKEVKHANVHLAFTGKTHKS